MKQCILIGLSLLSLAISTAEAASSSATINANNGLYLGGSLNIGSYQALDGASFHSSVITVNTYIRPYLGYHFNNYLAVEGGYDDLEDDSFNGDAVYGPDHYRLYGVDLAAKLIYPFETGFSVFGKLGVGIMHQNVFNQTYVNSTVWADSVSTRVMPLAGIGGSYNFTKNVAMDLSYMHMFKTGNIGEINIVGLGASYTFG